jgi:PAS domain S-box-containing protein
MKCIAKIQSIWQESTVTPEDGVLRKTKVRYLILLISIALFWDLFIVMAYCLNEGDISFFSLISLGLMPTNRYIIYAIVLSSIISFSFMGILLQFNLSKDFYFVNDIINRANDVTFIIDVQSGLIVYANKQACDFLNVTGEEITCKNFAEIDPVAGAYAWPDYLQTIREKGHFLYETTYRGNRGKPFPVEVNISPITQGRRSCLLAICRNISERQRAQEWHQTIIRAARDGFFVTDARGRFLEVNEAFCRLADRQQKELLQLGIGDLFDSPREVERHLQKTLYSGTGTFNCCIRLKDGRTTFLEASANYLPSDGGRFFAFLRDVTEKKEMQEALSAEKERLAVTLRSIGDGVIATDTRGNIILMNAAAEKITAWTQGEAINLPASKVLRVVDSQSGRPYEDPVAQILRTGKPAAFSPDSVLITKSYSRRIIAVSGAPIIDQYNQILGVVLVFQDKTREHQTEKELQKIDKLSSLSILAGGIAHDFNNILGVILGNVTLALALLKKGSQDLEPPLQEAERASLQAKALSQQLLTFARGGSPLKEITNIAPIIKESAKFACTGSSVRCEIELPDTIWPIEVDPGQISQVMQNLVINAIHAMPDGGVVRIRGENITLNGESDGPLPLRPGKYVKVSVEDQGIGIWPDHLPKIFDPYFTTKQKGSGLGLATVYSILKNHGGHITVDSTLSKGSTFTFYLPAFQAALPRKKQEKETLYQGSGKVLVMDDEPNIRANMKEILGLLGYAVDLAEDGAKALELYRNAQAAGTPYEVVITDLTVPGGMGGKETVQKLREMDPQVKAVVFSGYADDPILSRHEEYGFKGVITKPYTINDVSLTLHQVLSGNGGAETAAL